MIDENDAPEGYKAVAGSHFACAGCAFVGTARCPLRVECEATKRNDGHNVIFIKRDPA